MILPLDNTDPEPLDEWVAGLALVPEWLPEECVPRRCLRFVPTPLADEDEARALLIRHGLLTGHMGTHHVRIAALLSRGDGAGLLAFARELEERAAKAAPGHALHKVAEVARRAAAVVGL